MNTAGRNQRGFSLIELMVTVVIGLVLTLAVSTILVGGEGRNRSLLASNDTTQTGTYVAALLDGTMRSAGSGYSNRWQEVFGCRLNVTRDGAGVLPRAAAWPAPFASFEARPRLAPVLIGRGQSEGGSDVITVMRGNSGLGEMPLEVLALGPPLGLRNTLGLAANDLLLLADGGNDCLLLQAGVPAAGSVLLTGAGRFHTETGPERGLADFGPPSASTVLVTLGNAGPAGGTPANAPQFTAFGVGADRTLFALDLLGIEGTVPLPLADGVMALRGVYGVDDNGDGTLDLWVDPGTAPWDAATLMDGSEASRLNLARIVAVRLGMVLRSQRAEREDVAPASLTLFADLPVDVQQVQAIAAADRRYRHRTVELTVPLRNVLLARAP